jgi:hypothetical protein
MTNCFEVVVKCKLVGRKIANFSWDDLPLADIGGALPLFSRIGAWAGRARGAMGCYPAPEIFLPVVTNGQPHESPRPLSDRNDETKIRLDHAVARRLVAAALSRPR